MILYQQQGLKNIFRKSKAASEWSITSTAGVNIGQIKNSEASLAAEVLGMPFTPRLATLNVSIKNEGENVLSNIYVMAKVSDAFTLNNSGELFGSSWRMEKIVRLIPGQSIRFKLTLRSKLNTDSGALSILLSATPNESDSEAIRLEIPLKCMAVK